jgi:L-threonylcarbamoyladenylate synthase
VSKSATASSRVKERKAETLLAAVAALQRGDVIVFPTETLYGLGVDALDLAAVEKVFELKGRDANAPLPALVADRAMLSLLVAEISPLAEKLMQRFWPGPLTSVLPARKDIPKPLLNRTGGIGVRISSQPIATELVKSLGRPLTATSANPSGHASAHTVEEAKNYFAGRVEIFVDGGVLTSKTGSSVVEVIGDTVRILRDGEIGRRELQTCAGRGRVVP